MSHFPVIPDYIGWLVLVSAPFLAVFLAMVVYNTVCSSRRRELVDARDAMYEGEFHMWWERFVSGGQLTKVFCPFRIDENETCYATYGQAELYYPNYPHGSPFVEPGCAPVFDVACGVSLGRHWSVMDSFSPVSLIGRGTVCVTNRHVYLKGVGTDLCIPLEDIHTVAASCSCVMIGTMTSDRPLLINAVNGQKIRDILHILMGGMGRSYEEMI